MDCPRTGKPMSEIEISGVKVDVSTGCGGVWFDNFEFKKFDEPFESAGNKLIELMEKYKNKNVDVSKRINCPRHKGVVLMRHFYSVKQKIEIDECPQCAGIWLDPGELAEVRKLFSSEEERNNAADKFIAEVFNSPEIQAMKRKSEEDLQKARRFANMFKYICPSQYIPGKQNWGAF